MERRMTSPRFFSIADLALFFCLATVIYGIVEIANGWRAEYNPVTTIDLSVRMLPYYTLLSGIRGVVAYFISLGFSLVVGYVAARSKTAERIIIPALDILQSIPVLGFLPGLLLGLVALFPNSNFGIEIAAIIMIFTGQVWNMTFSFYSSLKSIPPEFKEAATVMNLNWLERFFKLELPFGAVNLAWNSLLSMAGGWFYLIPCEAMRLGNNEFRLPGIGAYMYMAIKHDDKRAMFLAIVAMVSLIILMDFVIWRPILAWVRRFRLEDVPGVAPTEPLMQIWIRESRILRSIKNFYYDSISEKRLNLHFIRQPARVAFSKWIAPLLSILRIIWRRIKSVRLFMNTRLTQICLILVILSLTSYGAFRLVLVLLSVPPATWIVLLRDALWTTIRVVMAVGLATLWAVPAGIWIGISPTRTKFVQPVIQILASFPAPMLYPILLGFLLSLGIPFEWGAMFLIFFGVQWYILFNVMAGAMRIPNQLNDSLALMNVSNWDRWRYLYLPSIFPTLVTGWVTAAGGAWNASVVAEYIYYHGRILKTAGLGAMISVAIDNGNFPLLAASLTLMVLVVILFNRVVWSRLYYLAQNRYRIDI